jgi:hypothetical protein
MANFIAYGDLGPEYLESAPKALLNPMNTFIGTLTSGGPTTVAIVNEAGTVTYGTFVLDTLNQPVSTGLIYNLSPRVRFRVVSGSGNFNIQLSAGG